MTYTPTSGQGAASVTATVSNVVANLGSGSGTVASGGTATPGTIASAQATETYEDVYINALNSLPGVNPVTPQSIGKY